MKTKRLPAELNRVMRILLDLGENPDLPAEIRLKAIEGVGFLMDWRKRAK